jgi:DNA replication protein DnaC
MVRAAFESYVCVSALELARGKYILRRENIIALGPSGTGKSHIALALGLAACQRGVAVGFVTAAGLVHQLMEARDSCCSKSSVKDTSAVQPS